jgi:hypothetical protein
MMRCPAQIILALLFAGPALAQIKRPDESKLVANGSFEDGTAGWSFLVSGANATGVLDSTEKHEGRNSFKLTNRSGFAPNVYARVTQLVSGMRPFTAYKVSCWVKGRGVGIAWIGGGPGWYTRTAFPKGDFDWQQVSYEIEGNANPGSYELMVLTESQTEALWVDDIQVEPVRVDQAKQDALYGELDKQLEGLKQKAARLQVQANSAKFAGNAYLRLGSAVAERFIGFTQNGPPGSPSLAWIRLQLEEVGQVLDEAERTAQVDPPVLRWHPSKSAKTKLKQGTFYEHGRPVYFAGYGHFQAVINDLPNFPALGASLIQDGRAGPSSMNADGTLQPGAISVLEGLDRAARFGMKVDFLLSPHYYPDWAQTPDLRNGNIGFLSFNIFHPKAKATIAKWAEVMAARLKDKPALHTVCLANEPVYNSSGRDPYTRPDFVRFLREKHGDVAPLNALYGASYRSFEEVVVPGDGLPAGQGARRAYYDWTTFNKEMFAGWHTWLNSRLKQQGLKVPTHTKIMVFQSLDRDKLHYGVDPELMCDATDLAGCDDYAFLGGTYAYDWLSNEFFYDLLHSFRGQPVFNSENHLIPDGTGPSHLPMTHSRAVLWQGGLHHQGSTTIWVWEQAADPSLAGSIYFRPGNVYGAGRAMLDLNRLAPEVTAINNARPAVALLYSQPSIFWEEKYQPTIYALYTALNFLGQNITFISERQLARGTAAKVQWLLVPNATHVLASTPPALARFVKAGGQVLLIGKESLGHDEYDRPLEHGAENYPMLDSAGQDPATAAALREHLTSVRFTDLRDSATGKPAWSVEFRAAGQGRATLVPLINLGTVSKTLSFPAWANRRALDLLSGEEVELSAVKAEPMVPRLLRIGGSSM